MSSEINICSIFSGFVFDICFLRVFIKKNTHTLSTNTRNTEHAGFYVLFVSVSEVSEYLFGWILKAIIRQQIEIKISI